MKRNKLVIIIRKTLSLVLVLALLLTSYLPIIQTPFTAKPAYATNGLICKAAEAYKNYNAKVGGVALDQAATFLANMDDIKGAYYDETKDRIVFVGKSNTTLPEFDKDDLAVAIKAVIFNKTIPAVSIENSNNGMMDVLYYGDIENTRFGKVLFEGDFKLKQYVLGYDINDQEIVSSVPGYKSVVKRYLDKNPTPNQPYKGRQWITPKDVVLKRDDNTNSFVFDTVTMELKYEPMQVNDPLYDQASEEFALHHTQNFDSFANEIPEYKDIKQLGKIVSVIKWLADNEIATDFNWASDYAPKIIETPSQVQELLVNNITYNGYNIQSLSGGVEYLTDNTYQAANGASSTLKTASEAVNAPKEDIHWTFTENGQQYESVAVAADAFRSLGAYSTSANDMSFDTCGEADLGIVRSYSSFSGGQFGIGRGWRFLPAQLVDNMPISSGIVTNTCENKKYRYKIAFQNDSGVRETFTSDCTPGNVYLPDDNSFHSTITATHPNSTSVLYSIKQKDQKEYIFEELYDDPQHTTNYYMRLVEIRDKNGNKSLFSYDTNIKSKLINISDGRGHTMSLNYNNKNLLSSIVDWSNRTISYSYDDQGNLLTVTDPRGYVTTYTYDTNNKLTSIKDRENNTILTNTYTPEAKIATQTNASNVTNTYTYDEVNKKVTKSDTVRTEETTYDTKARILSQKDPLNNTTTFTYGAELSPLTVTDKNGKTTTNTYDLRGNLVTVTDANNKTITYEYDTEDRITKITDDRYSPAKVTEHTYDSSGNLTEVDEDGKVSTFTYDQWGEMLTKNDPEERTTTWTRDTFGNPLTAKDEYDNTTSYEYNNLGWLQKVTDPESREVSYSYDNNGNKVTETNALGVTSFEYNKENNVKKTITPNAATTQFTYNTSQSIASVIDPLNHTTSYTRDNYQNMTAKQDALNRTTEYLYDKLNRRTEITTPLGKATNWEYDPNGNITKRIDANNQDTLYEYDNLNRLKKITYPNSSTVNYTYDDRGNVLTTVDPTGTTTYGYDKFDRLTQVTDSNNNVVAYEYDDADNLTKITYPGNKIVTYEYDNASRLVTVTDWNNKQIVYDYYKNGLLKTKTNPNGILSSYSYDNANKLSQLHHTKNGATLAKFIYQRDSLGNITKVIETGTTPTPTPTPGNTGSPYGGTPRAVPGTIQIEDFNTGGEGVAYHDVDSANNGGQYRTSEGVDLGTISGGYAMGWTREGEWQNYAINVETAGTYTFNARVASPNDNSKFHAEIDGVNVTGTMEVDSTGGWDNWTTLSKTGINLSAGQHNLKIVLDERSTQEEWVHNFDWISLTTDATPTPTPTNGPTPTPGNYGSPYGGTARTLPGTIQIEDFNTGGDGVGYHDVESSNFGGAYRPSDGVDISEITSGQYNIGWIREEEWLNYAVNVDTTGTYTFNARVASPNDNSKFHAEIDGVDVTGPMEIDNTGGWGQFATITKTGVNLTAGQHNLKIVMDEQSTQEQWIGDMDWVSFTLASTPTPTPTGGPTPTPGNNGSPYGGTARAVPGTVQTEDFNTGGENVAYHDLDSINDGNSYRTSEGVDISEHSSNEFNVGWTREGEWLKYAINVSSSGLYTFNARVASPNDNSKFHAEIDGVNVTGPMEIDNTGGWGQWATISKTGINLSAGQHILKIVMDEQSTQEQWLGDFDWFSFVSEGSSTPTPTPTTTATPTPTVTSTPTPTPTPLQVDLSDKTGKGHTLTNNGGTEVSTNLPFVESTLALDFESSESDYLTTPDTTDLSVTNTHQFTVEFWAKVESLSDNNTVISKNTPGQYEYKLSVGKANGSIEYNVFRLDGNNRYTGTSVASIITPGTWNHIALVVDDAGSYAVTNAKIYVNGNEVSYNSHLGGEPHVVANGTAPLEIGRYSPGSNYYDGMLDEVRFWNTARTTSQITQGMDNELNGTETGLVAYYQLDPTGNDDGIYYTYDLLSRLKKSSKPSFVYEYTYDNVGNMLTSKLNGTQSSYTYNNDNQLTLKDSTTFAYDNKGNQTDRGDKDQTYDTDNKLKTVIDPNGPDKEYIYDGNGNRIEEKTNGTASMEYVNDVSGELTHVLISRNLSTSTESYYLYGAGLIGRGGVSEQNRQYYLEDGTGNMRYLTDSNGNVLEAYTYDPSGNLIAGNTPTDFAYKGEQIDNTTGLYFMRARYYNPATGSFITRDPIEGDLKYPLTQNGYGFVSGNPINLSDPSGLWTVDINFSVNPSLVSNPESKSGLTSGILISDKGLYSYGGNGIATPGGGASVTFSQDDPQEGTSTQFNMTAVLSQSHSWDTNGNKTGASLGLGYPILGAGLYTVQTNKLNLCP